MEKKIVHSRSTRHPKNMNAGKHAIHTSSRIKFTVEKEINMYLGCKLFN